MIAQTTIVVNINYCKLKRGGLDMRIGFENILDKKLNCENTLVGMVRKNYKKNCKLNQFITITCIVILVQ